MVVMVLTRVLGWVLLLSVTAYAALRIFLLDYSLSLEPALLFAVLFICLMAADSLRRRRLSGILAELVRFAVLWVALVWLVWGLFLGRPVRDARITDVPVTKRFDSTGDSVQLSEYESGVYTMAREVSRGVDEAWLPVLILFWLAALPGLRALSQLDDGRTDQ